MIRSSDKQFPPLQTSGMAKDTSQSITLTTHHYIILSIWFLASAIWMRTRSNPCLLLHPGQTVTPWVYQPIGSPLLRTCPWPVAGWNLWRRHTDALLRESPARPGWTACGHL